MLCDVLRHGVETGSVRKDADIDLFVETLIAAYGFSYRKAINEGHDAAQLTAVMDRQIGLMFEGMRA